MDTLISGSIKYTIMDPTGNITALVESPVEIEGQPALAAKIMERHPEVEQVGFVKADSDPNSPVDARLRMAGGEFCGNASMCAAVLYYIRHCKGREAGQPDRTIRLLVSGAGGPVEVRLLQEDPDCFRAAIAMPPPVRISREAFTYANEKGSLPVVIMEGISHIIIDPDSVFYPLLASRKDAEDAVRAWCRILSADGLGLMFFEEEDGQYRLTPLVYIPGSDTTFWENSCASGTSAVGMYLEDQRGGPVDLVLKEPGGLLRFRTDPEDGRGWLYGTVHLSE